MTQGAPQSNSQSLDFEATLAELERVVTELDGEIKLDRALELFDRGMKLSTICQTFLRSAEQKIEVLKRSADGELIQEPFVEVNEEVSAS
jgi:exodeoxyribonuclease VII small subunit